MKVLFKFLFIGCAIIGAIGLLAAIIRSVTGGISFADSLKQMFTFKA